MVVVVVVGGEWGAVVNINGTGVMQAQKHQAKNAVSWLSKRTPGNIMEGLH